jgi:bifunctional non-homologous end joining protein LigD
VSRRRASLEDYAEKRDFSRTPEPRGAADAGGQGYSFVVHKHAARRLHYDLRLELDGVLKSWAVTRGPSLVPGEKRLAVQVEDHPLEYGVFEGVIPQGEYGAGEVIVWDRGRWLPEGDPHKGLAKGHLAFRLEGEKLKGSWHLVRMKRRPREKQDSWLLIKSEDEAARLYGDPEILEERPESVATGRRIEEMRGDGNVWRGNRASGGPEPTSSARPATPGASKRASRSATTARRKAGGAVPPDFIPPSLATPAKAPPKGPQWLHEVKLDGYRLFARRVGADVRLKTRTGLDWTERFSGLAQAIGALDCDSALIDGEAVALAENGATSFSALQEALSGNAQAHIIYYAFDLLHLDGEDLRPLPLGERKRRLAALLASTPADGPIRLNIDFDAPGERVLAHVCRLSLEGIVSKRRDRPYRSGRTPDWVKVKCVERQELVVIGYAPSTTASRAIGSLVLGYFEAGKLRYAGRVGTGFSERSAAELWQRLEPLRRPGPPLGSLPAGEKGRPVRWVEPKLVAEVELRGWTAAGIVWHASFRGLREDKPAAEVVREVASGVGKPTGGRPVSHVDPARFTHPERLLWPDAGVTKLGLAEYYATVWDWIGPHVVNRPLSLVRCPDGVGEACFFQKHAWAGLGKEVRRIRIEGEKKDYLHIDSLDGLMALVQASVLEIHTWGCRIEDLERADRMVLDLDPGPGVAWEAVVEAAQEVRRRLAEHGLASWVKTTGGKGLHVTAPLSPAVGFKEVKEFSRAIAEALAASDPQRYTASMSKHVREGRIYVDYLRNGRGATAIAPYSPRARPGAPVAAPLAWAELASGLGPSYFNVTNIAARLGSVRRDPWSGLAAARQSIGTGAQSLRRRPTAKK